MTRKALAATALATLIATTIGAAGCATTQSRTVSKATPAAPTSTQQHLTLTRVTAAMVVDQMERDDPGVVKRFQALEVQTEQTLGPDLGRTFALHAFTRGYGPQPADGPSAAAVFNEMESR